MFDFARKRVLVTGGARGIGAAAALAFRARGARVAVGARSTASYDAFAERPEANGVLPAIGDIRTRAGAQAVVAAAVEALGGLDVLVNSAGVFAEVAFAEVTQEHWDETIGINLAGTFFCSQAALPALEAAAGNIVNVASDAGIVGYPDGTAYCASKGGVVNLTRAMAVELARRVRVNCVCPGNVETDMIREAAAASPNAARYLERARERAPLRRMASPGEVAAAILYLASKEAAFTTGAALVVDGGGSAGF
ncbi:MAG: SDR family oxidoreductase [Steroidobacteraceae bacterium]|jgi:NAD(P)-dependent dehydrogenase (short-subunit alcohol dehydrogenase family)